MITNNLPIQPNSFVGRTEELVEISHLLDIPDCRLLTLLGPGGIGKTRLALEAAALMLNRAEVTFPNGIYFVPLQSLGSPHHIVSTIASAINFQFYPGGEPKQQLFSFLRDKHLLLLLDNFEHLLDGVDLLSDLVSTAPDVYIMITSRERLNLSSETLFRVDGLPVPAIKTAENVLDYSAVELFMQSARRVHRDFNAQNTDLNDIAHICRLVGGMPLAILLSAAWVDMLSLQEIAGEIEHGLELLETEMRDLPERHRSVRATFDHSWRLLSEVERDIFKKLSVFRGGFTREAAQAVTGASLKTLTGLVNKSFVQTVGNGRYDLHELLRQYGAAILNVNNSEADTVKALHCAYYAEFMRQRDLDFMGSDVKAALGAVDGDYDNIRGAWDEALRQARWDDLWKLAHSFFDFSWHLNRLEDAINPYAQAVAKLEEIGASEEQGELLAAVLAHQGILSLVSGKDFDSGGYQRAVRLMRRYPPSNRIAAHSLCVLGFVGAHRGELPEGERLMRDSIALCRTRGYTYEEAESTIYLMVTFSSLNINQIEIKALNEHVLELLQSLDSTVLMTLAHRQQGIILFEEGNFAQAKPLFKECFRNFLEFGDMIDALACQDFLGAIAAEAGDHAEALNYYKQLLVSYIETTNAFHIPYTLEGIAKHLAAQGKLECAVELCVFLTANVQLAMLGAAPPGIAPLLEQLEGKLTADIFAEAAERGKVIDRDAIIRELLAELSQPESRLILPTLLDPLSEREREVVTIIALGKSNSEIARELVLSKRTVEKHIANILSKLDFNSRVQIVRWAIENGLSDAKS